MIRNSLDSIFSLTIVVLFSLNSFSQSPSDYEDLWKTVEEYQKKSKPRSAIEEVEKIYLLAAAEQNQPQVTKAILKTLSLMASYVEDFHIKGLEYLDGELEKSISPVREILLSVKAEMTWSYFEQNRWMIMERENLEEGRSNDITTWSYNDFAEVANDCYLQSLNDDLKKQSVNTWKPIFENGKDSKYRPTLYDFLAFRALDHFSNPEAFLNKSVHEFNLNDKKYLSGYKEFLALDLEDNNGKNAAWQYMDIMQDLMRFHADDKDLSAFIDADLIRLKYVYENGNFEDRDLLFFTQLMNWFKSEGVPDIVAEAGLMAAKQKYHSYDEKGCYLCEVKDICDSVIKRYPKSNSAEEAKKIIKSIEAESIAIQVPETVPANIEELALVTVKNVNEIFLRVVQLDFDDHPETIIRGRNMPKKPQMYFKKDIVKSWDYSFNLPNDYQEHSLEIALPELPFGYYAIMVSPTKKFEVNGILSFTEFQVSDMRTFSVNAERNTEILVTNGHTGVSVSGVEVSLYKNEYRHGVMLLDEGVTDQDGRFLLKSGNNWYNAYVVLKNGEDVLVSSAQSGYYHHNNPERLQSWIFTDRAVYRPGQTIYFKALVAGKKDDDINIAASEKMRVELLDLNYQVRAEETLQTNEYGTLNGTFVLPNDLPTGSVTIRTPYGSISIRVEEYKRPSFEIEYDDIAARAKETDPYAVTGNVHTYSGLPVEGADVKYRITRSSYMPWRWWWRPFSDETKEIAFGTLQTDEDGKFNFRFDASPRKNDSNFFGYTYSINVTVSDQAGETHEETTTVIDAVRKIAVKTDLPEITFTDYNMDVSIEIINNLDEVEKCNGAVKIEKLDLPENVYRNRLWHQDSDINIFEKDDFSTRFPNDYFEAPSSYSSLPVEKKVLSKDFSDGKVILKTEEWKQWTPGVYRLTVKAISGIDTASLKREFVIVNPEKNIPAENEIFNVYHDSKKFKPGDVASILLSSVKDMEVFYILNDGNTVIDRKTISLNNSMEKIEIPILEAYRGNVFVQLFANLNGRVYQHSLTLDVPYLNKVLDVEFATFREVTEPGSEESWTLKVKDYEGNPVQSEMLITMYDRALDAFAPLSYHFAPFRNRYNMVYVQGNLFGLNHHRFWNAYAYYGSLYNPRNYDKLIWSPSWGYGYMGREQFAVRENAMPVSMSMEREEDQLMMMDKEMAEPEEVVSAGASEGDAEKEIELRTDFSETAFFYPNLKTNEDGMVEIKFKAPQSVTGWKVLGLVHTKDLKNATFENELVTRKEIMITPNMPRFVRQGDKLVLQARINSMMEEEVSVETSMELFDPETNNSLNNLIAGFNRKIINMDAKGSAMVEWEVEIPFELSAIGIRTFAKTDKHTDGEEHIIPVLPSQTLIIESLPISVDGEGTYDFTFANLINKGTSVNNFALTLEYTANPAWYAVQALPYLEESRSKNAASIFNRYYANSLASHIANYNPQIKRIFDMWRNQSAEALLSALEKNQELKTTLLQESPWLAEAKDETEQKRRIALLFDINRISQMKAETWSMLTQMQYPDGSWPWFEGMRPSLYTTLSIVENSARLYYLGVENSVPSEIIKAAGYLDMKAKEEYDERKKRDDFDPEKYHISNFAVSWLYARSLLGDNINSVMDEEWYEFYLSQLKKHWTSMGLYQQSLASIILYFNVEPMISEEIIASLKERAMYSDKLGMYWREMHSSPYWYNAPIPTMASLIEAFTLIEDDGSSVRQMKKWLLTQKQTNRWSSSIGTVHAIYALLLQGDEMLSGSNDIEISLGGDVAISKDEAKEPGTGYIKKVWHGKEIESAMGEIEVTTYEDRFSWGALHWQYYAPYSEIKSAGNGLTINRKLYKKVNTEQGPELVEIVDESSVKTGERIVVRMEVTADRDYSFVHLKDQRTAAFEPVETRSGYRYKNGAGFYLSVRDASVNYFFDHLRKGAYTFEYELFRVRTGDYTGGLSTIQCVYAPEFNAHSSGE